MKRYSKEVEHRLYRLYVCRQRRDRMAKMELGNHGMYTVNSAITTYEDQLALVGLSGDVLEQALRDRWLEFEGNEMRFDRMDKCLTLLAQAQARVKAGIPREHRDVFLCNHHEDCIECDCFREATEEQRSNFDHGADIFSGDPIPGFQVEDDETA